MANNIITSSIILAETLDVLYNESAFLKHINVEYSDKFAQDGAKAGDTVNVRLPVRGTVRSGAVANIQDVNEPTVPITMDPEFGIDWAFSDRDLTLKVDKFRERYLQPFGTQLATELDLRIAALYKTVSNFSGTPGVTPASALSVLNANVLLDDNSAPRDMRMGALTQRTNVAMVDALKGLLNDNSSAQTKAAMMRSNFGLDFNMSQNLPTHTVGPLGGTPLVNGASQGLINSGSTDNPYASTTSLVTDGWTAAAALRLRAGDVFTIAGVNAVNPANKQDLGRLQQFVVTADTSSDGSGNATVVIRPAIIAGGAYQNVTARPADNAAITVVTGAASTAYPQNLIYHKNAFTMVTADMEVPKGMDMADRQNYKGVSLRFVRGFDITNNRRICRFDVLAGFAALRPEWAVRLTA